MLLLRACLFDFVYDEISLEYVCRIGRMRLYSGSLGGAAHIDATARVQVQWKCWLALLS
tara:strand:+ start:653 stop:829 length:177 start_codon:yes stop_codon:yes gene_type:complete